MRLLGLLIGIAGIFGGFISGALVLPLLVIGACLIILALRVDKAIADVKSDKPTPNAPPRRLKLK